MSEALESINGLIVPLLNDPLLLPNVAVAELVGYRLSQAANQGPEWFLGWTQWRDQPVPMVDLDALRAFGGAGRRGPAAYPDPQCLGRQRNTLHRTAGLGYSTLAQIAAR